MTSSPNTTNTTDGDLTADKVHLWPSFAQPIGELADELTDLAQRQQTASPSLTESDFDLLSIAGGLNDGEDDDMGFGNGHVAATDNGFGNGHVAATDNVGHDHVAATDNVEHDHVAATDNGLGNGHVAATDNVEHDHVAATDNVEHDPVAATDNVEHDPVAARLQHDELSQHQQQHPTTNEQPTAKEKCFAVVEVEHEGMPARLKYVFLVTEAEPFSASAGDEHCCNPTVEHMTQTLLPNHLDKPIEQLTAKFNLQLQILDTDFEQPEYIDIVPREWCSKRVQNGGKYKMVLHPKLDNNNAAKKIVPDEAGDEHRRCDDDDVLMGEQQNANAEGERRCDDEDVPMSEQQQNANKEDWERIDRFHLSGKARPGNLYNVNSDNFITSNDSDGFGSNIFNMSSSYTEQSVPTLGNHLDKLDERTKILGPEQKLSVHYIGRGNRRLTDVLLGNNETPVHFVLLYSESATTTPPVAVGTSQHDGERLHHQCMGQLYQLAGRGKSCSFVDLDVLPSDGDEATTAYEGLPQGILELDGFPNIGRTRLVKMRGHSLLTADCVMEEANKLAIFIARIENPQRTEVGAVPRKKAEPCSLPCPLCKGNGDKSQNNDFLWGCDDCGETLAFVNEENVPTTHLYCACGATPVDEFSYRCANANTHGNEFKRFGTTQLANELKRLRSKGVLTILLLGETGVGKSTLINAIVNYLKHPTFDEAIQADGIEAVIPARFCTEEYDEEGNLKHKDVFIGKMDKDECLEPGKSQTKSPNAYMIPSKLGYKVRLIDAPGILDSGGITEDNLNLHKTLSFISTLYELHAICILLKPNSTRTGPAFKYCINGLLTYLHKNAAENIFFVFTNARGSNYKMGKTRELLQGILNPIEVAHKVSIPLHRDRIYCLDNESFEHLCLIKKANVRYSPENMADFSKSWTQAEQELQRMLKNVAALKPHRISETVSLNQAHRTIVDLTYPLAIITQKIQDNLIRIKEHQESINEGEQEMTSAPTFETVQFVPLPHPRTVCTSDRCTEVKITAAKGTAAKKIKLFKRHCHPHCYLENIIPENMPNESLLNCWAMSRRENCQVCGCSWRVHMHFRFDQVVLTHELDEAKRKQFADKRVTLSTLEAYRLQMLHEQKTIYFKAALFCSFLKTWALKPYNDSMEVYILLSIQDAEQIVTESGGETDQKLQVEKLKGLRESLRLYKEQKKIIDAANANDSTGGPKMITAEDVTKFFDQLCTLPIFGEDIKQMYEQQQKTRKDNEKVYTENMAGSGFMPKPSRSGMPGNIVEQYLNDLEQHSLLNLYAKKQREIDEQQKRRRQPYEYGTSNANARQCNKGKSSVKSVDKLRGAKSSSRGNESNNTQKMAASGSAGGFDQQPAPSTSSYIGALCRKIPAALGFVRPSPAEPPQEQQQQQLESCSSSSSSDITTDK
uniref:G domain-containing protein n=1 Tax=Globodera pallida TaxID=36090 RepID=A0A183BJ85_GLOPA